MKNLNFTNEELEKVRTSILEQAYVAYSGVRQFPLCKKSEYAFLLECAETDCINAGRDLEKESHTMCEKELWEEVSISMLGQWKRSHHFAPCVKRVQQLFDSPEHFYKWVESKVVAEWSHKYGRYDFVSTLEKRAIKNAYLGIVPEIYIDWAT